MGVHKNNKIQKGTYIASIDLGSHTARMLIGQYIGDKDLFRTIARERAYIRLAEGLNGTGYSELDEHAVIRTSKILKAFSIIAEEYKVERIWAVSTGVVRRAKNRDHFMKILEEKTGIKVKIISGEKEAMLTLLGALHSLDIPEKESLIFDLGGGTTEFIFGDVANKVIRSLPLGAVVLTKGFFSSDPPQKGDILSLSGYVGKKLRTAFDPFDISGESLFLVGTGGTVITLCAMINGIPMKDITHERMNGQILKRSQIQRLVDNIKVMSYEERLRLKGLDSGRAGVILAGAIAVSGILEYFRVQNMMISYSDILEGIILEIIKGVRYE